MTTDIVRKITKDKNPPEVAYLIIQDKAVFRFMGRPKESQISILLKPWFEVGIVTNIDKKEFTPSHQVKAVLADFRKRESPLVEPKNRQWFRDFVVYGYNQWQPTILDAFRKVFTSKQRKILEKIMEIRYKKPSDLTLNQWLKIFEVFMTYVASDKKQIIYGAEKKLREKQKNLRKWHRTR